jgi:putative phosphoesterase
MRIGLIADTHGLLRPEALDALRGCERILHAGDIGNPAVLEGLATIAPVTAIRGNNDSATWACDLPDVCTLRIDGIVIHMLHDLKELAARPPAEPVDVIVAGHSHRPLVEQRDGVLLVNPGSAGRRRFKLPVTVGELRIAGGTVEARVIALPIAR